MLRNIVTVKIFWKFLPNYVVENLLKITELFHSNNFKDTLKRASFQMGSNKFIKTF